MKKKFQLVFGFVFITFFLASGQSIPKYARKTLSFKIPVEMRGATVDTANQQGDFYIYTYNGMLFLDKPVVLPSVALGFDGNADLSNPFALIALMWYGYQTTNIDLLKSLTTEDGRANLEAKGYFENISQKAIEVREIDTIKLLAAFELGNGIMVFTKNSKYGIERNYLEKIDGRYYIVPLSFQQYDLIIRNYVMYLYYNPQPYRKPQNVVAKDSVAISEKINFSANVSKKGRFVVLARPNIGESIFANVEDNSAIDENDAVKKVRFSITLSYFLPKGENEVYIVESNFPVLFVTQTLLDNALKIKIKVE